MDFFNDFIKGDEVLEVLWTYERTDPEDIVARRKIASSFDIPKATNDHLRQKSLVTRYLTSSPHAQEIKEFLYNCRLVFNSDRCSSLWPDKTIPEIREALQRVETEEYQEGQRRIVKTRSWEYYPVFITILTKEHDSLTNRITIDLKIEFPFQVPEEEKGEIKRDVEREYGPGLVEDFQLLKDSEEVKNLNFPSPDDATYTCTISYLGNEEESFELPLMRRHQGIISKAASDRDLERDSYGRKEVEQQEASTAYYELLLDYKGESEHGHLLGYLKTRLLFKMGDAFDSLSSVAGQSDRKLKEDIERSGKIEIDKLPAPGEADDLAILRDLEDKACSDDIDRQIVKLSAEGQTQKSIAKEVGRTVRTVHERIKKIRLRYKNST